MTSVRRILLKAEALFWTSRVAHAAPIYLVGAAGYMAPGGSGQPSPAWLIGLVACLGLVTGSLGLLNDLMDEEADRVTTPNAALTSGLLTRTESWSAIALASATSLVGLRLLSGDWIAFASLFLLAGAAWAIMLAYSRIKGKGVWGSLVMALLWPLAAISGWLLARTFAWSIGLIALYAYLAGFSDNILGAIRDVDTDPQTNIFTLPVRIGVAPAFRVAAAVDFGCLAVLAILWALSNDRQPRAIGLVVAAIAGAVMISRYSVIPRSFKAGDGRTARMVQMRPWVRASCLREIGLISVCAPFSGLLLGFALFAIQWLAFIGSGSRIAGGAIKRAFERQDQNAELKSMQSPHTQKPV